jgi:energy-coupling factor transport system ATP-binding protein
MAFAKTAINKSYILPHRREEKDSTEMIKKLNIKVGHQRLLVSSLSGGNQQKVVLAKWLSVNPKVLILDVPTAGLDPRGRDAILKEIKILHDVYKKTVILVSHSMEDVAKLVDKIIVMSEGKCILTGTPREIFKEADMLCEVGLGIPQVTSLVRILRQKGIDIREDVLTVDEAKQELIKYLRSREK